MPLHEDFVLADPVLERVFLDERRFAPALGSETEAAMLQSRISERKVAFFKSRSIDTLERLQLGFTKRVRYVPPATDDEPEPEPQMRYVRVPGFREMYFALRDQCDGYYLDMLQRLVDGTHIIMFEHDKHDEIFRPQYSQRFRLWQKYAQCRPVNQPGGRWF